MLIDHEENNIICAHWRKSALKILDNAEKNELVMFVKQGWAYIRIWNVSFV